MASNAGFTLIRAVLIIPLIVLWILVHPEPSYACSCVENGPPIEELANSAAVFMGRVVSVRELDPEDPLWGGAELVSSSDPATIGFAVQTVWKGPLYQTMYLTTLRSELRVHLRRRLDPYRLLPRRFERQPLHQDSHAVGCHV